MAFRTIPFIVLIYFSSHQQMTTLAAPMPQLDDLQQAASDNINQEVAIEQAERAENYILEIGQCIGMPSDMPRPAEAT